MATKMATKKKRTKKSMLQLQVDALDGAVESMGSELGRVLRDIVELRLEMQTVLRHRHEVNLRLDTFIAEYAKRLAPTQKSEAEVADMSYSKCVLCGQTWSTGKGPRHVCPQQDLPFEPPF